MTHRFICLSWWHVCTPCIPCIKIDLNLCPCLFPVFPSSVNFTFMSSVTQAINQGTFLPSSCSSLTPKSHIFYLLDYRTICSLLACPSLTALVYTQHLSNKYHNSIFMNLPTSGLTVSSPSMEVIFLKHKSNYAILLDSSQKLQLLSIVYTIKSQTP